jgi:hypothetical protein
MNNKPNYLKNQTNPKPYEVPQPRFHIERPNKAKYYQPDCEKTKRSQTGHDEAQ